MKYNIAVIKGDGIGPEVITEAMKVLTKVAEKFAHELVFTEVLAGGAAIDAVGECLPQRTVDICKASDAVLLGAVGGAKYDTQPVHNRPEQALLGIREKLELFANIRPAKMYAALSEACPIKEEIIGDGFDIVVVRELTGDVYFGKKGRAINENGDEVGYDIMNYSVPEIERIAKRAFEMAKNRRKKVHSVHKSNVLETSRLWKETVHKVAKDYPDIELIDMYVDNAAMQLVRNPRQFDIIVTGNLFGDILSDEASMITGSIGLLPSASIGYGKLGMYEPIHGSAPDIAGQGIANPIAAILSAAMMLRNSFELIKEAEAIESAVETVLNQGYRTLDIAKNHEEVTSTSAMGDLIVERI